MNRSGDLERKERLKKRQQRKASLVQAPGGRSARADRQAADLDLDTTGLWAEDPVVGGPSHSAAALRADPPADQRDQEAPRQEVADQVPGAQGQVQDALGQAQDVPRVLPEAAPKAQEIQGFLDRAMADLGGGDRGSKAPSFGGTDYQAWVFRWEQWAVGEDLWEFYDGTAKRPEPPENADAAAKEAMLPEQRRWDKANQKAFAALVQALQPDELVKLIREYGARAVPRAPVGTPRQPARPAEAWKRLEGYFCQKQFSSQIIFERQLMALRMNPEESVAQYWARADDLRQNLEAVGGEMSKGTWMNRIIAGLPADWENVQVYLTTQFMTLTEEGLLFALTSEGNRRAEQKQGDGFYGQGLKD